MAADDGMLTDALIDKFMANHGFGAGKNARKGNGRAAGPLNEGIRKAQSGTGGYHPAVKIKHARNYKTKVEELHRYSESHGDCIIAVGCFKASCDANHTYVRALSF